MDNLESSTYEVFEKDPVKYTEYKRAICKAILDKTRPANDDEDRQAGDIKETMPIIVMVLGAGRGDVFDSYCVRAACVVCRAGICLSFQRCIEFALHTLRATDNCDAHPDALFMIPGPLVRASLEAADLAERQVRVFAVEKNPNAIVTLLTQKEETWKDRVEVIALF